MLWRFFQRFSSGLLRGILSAQATCSRVPSRAIAKPIQPRPQPIIAYLTT
jgi:hypothetical protein